jgi:ribonuclease P protein component
VLKKINRGFKKKDFERILGEGKTIQTPLFGVRYKSLSPAGAGASPFEERENVNSRFGWIISKKISKRAVDRNKIKRKLSEVIVKNMIDNVEMVVLVKKNILDASIEEIIKCWEMVVEKIQK